MGWNEMSARTGRISWRDDSILTCPGLHNWPTTFNVARPELFESAWRKFPTVLETSHYHEALRDGAYRPKSSGGAENEIISPRIGRFSDAAYELGPSSSRW